MPYYHYVYLNEDQFTNEVYFLITKDGTNVTAAAAMTAAIIT